MAEAEAVAAPAIAAGMTADQRHWLLRRLHSLSGIIPIGGFLFFHLFENAFVLRGGDDVVEGDRVHPQPSVSDRGRSVGAVDSDSVPRDLRTWSSRPPRSPTTTRSSATTSTPCSASPGFSRSCLSASTFSRRAHISTPPASRPNYLRMHNFMMNPLFLTIYIVGTTGVRLSPDQRDFHIHDHVGNCGRRASANARESRVRRAVRRARDRQRLDSDRVPRTRLRRNNQCQGITL